MSVVADRQYSFVDKTGWGDGPWNDEPDKLQWVDEASGLDCLIRRGPLGNLCGYVGVPPGHPLHGRAYSGDWDSEESSPDSLVDVHGGLTYADRCQEDASEESGICHVPGPGRPSDVWWFGFDCGHSFDLLPAMRARERTLGLPPLPPIAGGPGETYRNVAYVQAECASLARQLAEI